MIPTIEESCNIGEEKGKKVKKKEKKKIYNQRGVVIVKYNQNKIKLVVQEKFWRIFLQDDQVHRST